MFRKSKVAVELQHVEDSSFTKQNNKASRQFIEFLNSLGASLEQFIDNSPLGVSTPKPWSPSVDKAKSRLSNPVVIIEEIRNGIYAFSPTNRGYRFTEEGNAFIFASAKFLRSLREGLENAAESDVYDVVPSGTGESYVTVGVDNCGNTSRSIKPPKDSVSEAKKLKKRFSRFTQKKVLPFIDTLLLLVNGIVVSEDDCSVCSSVEKYQEEEDFEDCPSVVTEVDTDDFKLGDAHTGLEGGNAPVNSDKEQDQESDFVREIKTSNCAENLACSDDEDYVLADTEDVVDGGFVLAD